MLRKLLIVSASILLTACNQQPQAVSAPPATQKNFTVLFNTDQSALSAEAKGIVAQAAASFKAGGRSVAVSGHTDTTGTPEYNLALSQRRAAAVRAELEASGVPASAIAALGYGEQNLPVQTAQNVSNQRNRSVDIVITDRAADALLSDTDYCKRLSAVYRRYRPDQIDEAAAEAMSRCETPGAAAAIPVLERALSAQKIPLPPRAMPRG